MGKFYQVLLAPLSFLFGLFMQIRNCLFDLKILPSKSFEIPVLSVGNLSYGGTGKTPMVEYLVMLLKPSPALSILSRGYGRESKGFIVANKRSNVKYIGDESLQYQKKFPEVRVAVDEQRKRGITLLLQKFPDLEVVLLDDAFQHRYVKPGLSILLTDYHRLYSEDYVLPSGTLREFRRGAGRADILVVTKTPKVFSPISRRRILEELHPASHQVVCFSYIKYSEPIHFQEGTEVPFPEKVTNCLLITGIANPYPLQEHMERKCSELVTMSFPDHHPYNEKDVEMILKKFNDLPTQKKVMVTTEKDLMRLKSPELCTKFRNMPLFYVPIEIDFHGKDKEIFDKKIINYVEKSKRNH